MSQDRFLAAERDVSGAPSVSLDEAKEMRTRRWQSDGLVRDPEREDEQGALLVRVPLFSTERIAYVERAGRACLLFLDRASQPRADASAPSVGTPSETRQSVAPRTSQPGDAGPLWGSPGCSVPDTCAPATPAPPPLKLVCSSCGAKPKPGVVALLDGTHYRTVEHGAGIPGRRAAFQSRTCGKWRRA